jgi:hypothetical protein
MNKEQGSWKEEGFRGEHSLYFPVLLRAEGHKGKHARWLCSIGNFHSE